jgi:NAD(P)-dependent dehydrogenase (short-subunit alcohol dehydrogenase family)
MSIDFSVKGKHVLITGGTSGIGAAFAEAFSQAGAMVTIVDIAPPRADQNSDLRFEQVDMCDDTAVAALAARTERMDVVIHCAGRVAIGQEYSPIVFNEIVNLHLTGALRLANAFRPHLKASRGCIIHIASMTSYFAAPLAPAYGAAKTGIVSLTRTLAVEFASDGIRVNAIAPGSTLTAFSNWRLKNPDGSLNQAGYDAFVAQMRDMSPLGSTGEAIDQAHLILYLASEAGRWATGNIFRVNGGMTTHW